MWFSTEWQAHEKLAEDIWQSSKERLLFEEPGILREVARMAANWFIRRLGTKSAARPG
jgi:hypothetical protein